MQYRKRSISSAPADAPHCAAANDPYLPPTPRLPLARSAGVIGWVSSLRALLTHQTNWPSLRIFNYADLAASATALALAAEQEAEPEGAAAAGECLRAGAQAWRACKRGGGCTHMGAVWLAFWPAVLCCTARWHA